MLSFLNGALAGLVAITASADSVSSQEAVLIGIVAGLLSELAALCLLKLKIDDVLNVFPAHGVAGMWGVLAVGLFVDGNTDGIAGDMGVQALGLAVISVWAFGISFVGLWLVNRWSPLRVSFEGEHVGLNISEHEASTEQFELVRFMEQQRQSGNFSQQAPVDPTSDLGIVAYQYNQVLSQLDGALSKAEIANRAKSDFLANMSHELRTPLNSIIGFSEIMKGEVFGRLGNDKYKSYVGDIHMSANHLLSVISDILDISKIESGETKLEEAPLSFDDVIKSATRLVSPAAQKKRIIISPNLKHGLPNFLGDERLIKQILVNLLSNAVKFTDPEGDISISTGQNDDGGLWLSVTDSGTGIAKEDLDYVLKPFTQGVATAMHAHEGTGLGLPLCDQLADLHGGRVDIESELGVGTSVRVSFPPERTIGYSD